MYIFQKLSFIKMFWYTAYIFMGQPAISLRRLSISFWLVAFVSMYGQLITITFYLTALYDQLTSVHSAERYGSEKEILAAPELTRIATFPLYTFGNLRDANIKVNHLFGCVFLTHVKLYYVFNCFSLLS